MNANEVHARQLLRRIWWISLSLLVVTPLLATGVKVAIILNGGNEIVGELLVVTDTILIVSRTVGESQDRLEADKDGIYEIRRNDIKQLTVLGKSYIPDGVLLGSLFGIGVGALLSYEPHGSEAYGSNFDPQGGGPNAILIGLAAGAVLGGFAGMMATTNDEIVGIEGKKAINGLKKYSRYYDRPLPDFIERHLAYPAPSGSRSL